MWHEKGGYVSWDNNLPRLVLFHTDEFTYHWASVSMIDKFKKMGFPIQWMGTNIQAWHVKCTTSQFNVYTGWDNDQVD